MELVAMNAAGEKAPIIPVSKPILFANSVQLTGHQGDIYACRFSPCGRYLVSGGHDRQLLVWDVFESKMSNCCMFKAHKNAILDIAWFNDSQKFISASADRTLSICDLEDIDAVHKLRYHENVVNSVDVAKRGTQMIVTGGDDFTVKIYDLRDKEPSLEQRLNYQITSVCFGKNNDFVFFGGIDNQIKYWNLRKNEIEYVLLGHTDSITGLSVSNSGNFLLSNAMDHTVRAWDIRAFVEGENRLYKTFFSATHNFERNLLRCSWNKDDTYLTAGSADRFVYVWDFEKGTVAHKLGGHNGSVNDAVFHPTYPNLLASASSDATLYVGQVNFA